MGAKYYSNLYEMEDTYRNKKYFSLLMTSLQNDLSKWSEELSINKTVYKSPTYNTTKFIIEIRYSYQFAYVYHIGTPPITDRQSELISDDFNSELKKSVTNLREKVYTPEIYEIEKLVGAQNGRKEKLQFLDLEQIKEIIEESYQDWSIDKSEVNSKFIAKLMYAYRRREDIYSMWLEKFDDDVINNELKKIKGQ